MGQNIDSTNFKHWYRINSGTTDSDDRFYRLVVLPRCRLTFDGKLPGRIALPAFTGRDPPPVDALSEKPLNPL